MHQEKKKIHEILWKSRFRVETITFLRFFRAAYLRRGPRTTFADQGPSKTVAFFRIPSKIFMSGTLNFRIIDRNIKAIFREYFSSFPFDSGKIFKIMTFCRGPRTRYSTAQVVETSVTVNNSPVQVYLHPDGAIPRKAREFAEIASVSTGKSLNSGLGWNAGLSFHERFDPIPIFELPVYWSIPRCGILKRMLQAPFLFSIY